MSTPTSKKKRKAAVGAEYQRARQRFIDTGTSIAAWARSHGFSERLVYNVLAGRPSYRGQSHQIAVALGIKKVSAAAMTGSSK